MKQWEEIRACKQENLRVHTYGWFERFFFITQVINWQEGHADSEPYSYYKTLFDNNHCFHKLQMNIELHK